MRNVKILGIVEGDPFNYLTWSGSSKYLFDAIKENGNLYSAISTEPSIIVRRLFQLINISPDMKMWRFRYNTDTDVYDQRTKIAIRHMSKLPDDEYNVILQIGAKFDLTKRKKKLTIAYHDSNFMTKISSPFPVPKVSTAYINKVLQYEKNIFDKLDHIFTMSAWLANVFVNDIGIPSRKVTPVGAGINLPYIGTIENKRYEEPNILFIGKEFERKGGSTLLKAFEIVRKEIKNATLTIIGPRLESLPAGVRCLGFLSKYTEEGIRTLIAEYLSASIFVMPSLYEPYGVVFLEAMAHKLPCIGTNTCAMPEIIDGGITGFLVDVDDSIALGKRMLDLLKDPGMCKSMGDRGYEKYLRHYTWNRVAGRMVETSRNLM